MTQTDQAHNLLVRIKYEDSEALQTLYGVYLQRFYGYASRHLSNDDAIEVVQDVFMRVLDRISTYDEIKSNGKGEPWLWTICVNVVNSKLRKIRDQNKEEPLTNEEFIPDNGPGPEEKVVDHEMRQAIWVTYWEMSEADQAELWRGKGTGPGGRIAWRRAQARYIAAFNKHYKGSQDNTE